jgi:hypothetical protein
MAIVGGLDVHRQQITFDYVDTVTGQVCATRPCGSAALKALDDAVHVDDAVKRPFAECRRLRGRLVVGLLVRSTAEECRRSSRRRLRDMSYRVRRRGCRYEATMNPARIARPVPSGGSPMIT